MDLINELENDVALAIFLGRRDPQNDPRKDIRDLIGKIQSALRPLADRPHKGFRFDDILNEAKTSEMI